MSIESGTIAAKLVGVHETKTALSGVLEDWGENVPSTFRAYPTAFNNIFTNLDDKIDAVSGELHDEFVEIGLSADTSANVSGSLPYDAELEYIEKTSTENSYFNITGYTPLWNDKIQAKFSTTENRTKFFYMAREGANKPSRGFLKMATSGQFRIDGTNGTASVAQNFTPANPSYTLGAWFEVYDNGSASVQMFGGAGANQSYSASSGTVNGYLRIFTGAYANSWGQMKFGYFRAWHGNSYDADATLAVDLIPVRVGTEPRIYDRATNTLYAPGGANDIVCGPDRRRTAVAIGSQASAQEQNIAIGSTATAGPNPVNGKVTSIAMGDGAKANNGIAIGDGASASDNYFGNQMQPVAIGRGAEAKGTSISIGPWADSGGTTADSVGQQNISIGRVAGPRDKDKSGVIHIGYNSVHPNLNNNAVAIGTTIGTVGSDGIAIGRIAQQSGSEGVAIGYNANANGLRAVSIGCYSQGTAAEAVAVGHNTGATGNNSVAMGYNAKASQNYSVAVGQDAKTTGSSGTGAVAFGSGAQANSNGGVALGGAALANYDAAIAIGKYVETNAASAITIGTSLDSDNRITNTLSGSVQFWDWTAFKRNEDNTNLILDSNRIPYLNDYALTSALDDYALKSSVNTAIGTINTNFTNIATMISTKPTDSVLTASVGSRASGWTFSSDGSTADNKVRIYHWGQMGVVMGSARKSSAISANTAESSLGTITMPSGYSILAAFVGTAGVGEIWVVNSSGTFSIRNFSGKSANTWIGFRIVVMLSNIGDRYSRTNVATI